MKRSGKAGQRALFVVGSVFLLGGGALAYVSAQHTPRVRPGAMIGEINLGGLTESQAAEAVESWFKKASSQPLKLASEYLEQQPVATAAALGASLDVEATMKRVPFDGFWQEVSRTVAKGADDKTEIVPVYSFDDKKIEELGDFIEENMKAGRPARVTLSGGKIVRQKEIPGMKLDQPKLSDAVAQAMLSGEKEELPMILAPKKVPDEELDKVKEVVASYATNFNNGQRARSANIKLAADIINGIVLMPGEKFSFNRHVGRRTAEGGFRVAGVFVNGRKEEDIGGGICQVSTTLYNAAVLSDLKIVTRSNHSRPVPYVPIGRDAAVSYPNPDLVIENNKDIPVALAASVGRGRIEFSVLGIKTPGRTIRIAQGRVSTSPNGVKYMQDDTLGYGVNRVIEGGSDRRRIQTFKVVMENGQEVSRENLHFSYYTGTPRIIARNSKARPAAPAAPPAGTEGAAGARGATPGPATSPSAAPAPTSASPSTPQAPAAGD